MEAIRSSETSGATQRTTRRHIPEEDTPQSGESGPGRDSNRAHPEDPVVLLHLL
jgi:hypothetical protein